ncbi:hypothetical protein [Schinkia azotoformans]|uniref:hypothetical protein n=1 Tax=Schinkia azotoformans TaxID=1454 RepID=UPI002DBE9C1B|nr:hypothetical protein [Schinkia azotoformans]MEC1716493.1 hypothetical protein [Schinkia azotoformans]MEC1756245.1 hypothetical protein [Schinkia azotoformans]
MSNLGNVKLLTVDLFNRWRHLLGEVVGSNLDALPDEVIENMKDLHNKLALTVLTQDRYLLAVTGLQGAGKTTLVKCLYDLDHTFLRDNDGRGEKRPILITESNVKTPEGYVSRSSYSDKEGFVITTEKVSPDEFDRVAREPKKEEIWLELKVPNRYFHDEKKSLILLPGFEKNREELSQQLLEHVLYLSTSSIVVFRKDTFARANNIEMVERVQDIYDNVKPIYVLTHGDVNPENNEEIRKQLIEVLELNDTDIDRVIMSGDPSRYKEDWIGQLIDRMGKYAFLTDESEGKKMALLEELFRNIRNQIQSLEEFFKKQEEKAIIASSKHSFENNTYRLVEQFEGMYGSILEDLEKDILATLNARKEDAIKHFNSYVKQNEGFWKGFFNRFSPNAIKDEERIQAAIKQAWMDADNLKPEVAMINVTTSYIEERSGLLKDPIFQEQAEAEVAPAIEEDMDLFKIEGLDEEEEVVTVKDEPTALSLKEIQNMTSLDRINKFFEKDREKKEIIPLYREDLKALSLMGTMLCRQALYEKELWEQNASKVGHQEAVAVSSIEDLDINALNKTLDGIENVSEKLSKLTPHLLKSIPLILGVDVVLDGQADLVLHVTQALTGIGITITPLQLLGAIGVAVAVVYGVNAVQQAVHETNQRQLKIAHAGQLALNQIPEIQTKAYIETLRRVFEKMADHLSEVHRERLGEFDQDAQVETIRYSLRRIKQVNSQLQKMVYEHAPVII